ncbi:Uncharacterised protein [uncultured archaeon]|nr:Uncharacterised protein [uncultured archaeon]
MKKVVIHSNPDGPGTGKAPVWAVAFSNDIKKRLDMFPANTPASPMTLQVAHLANTPDLSEAQSVLGFLRQDPGAVCLFSGSIEEQKGAFSLWGVARRAAVAKHVSVLTRKAVAGLVLDLFYDAGQRDVLIEAARDPLTPSDLAFCVLACLYSHKDSQAFLQVLGIESLNDLYRAPGLAHNPELHALARKMARHFTGSA